jgi:hypothetical protein
MLASLLRLFALRPILAGSLVGVPIVTLLLLGLATALFLKALLYLVLPALLVFWVVKRVMHGRNEPGETRTL